MRQRILELATACAPRLVGLSDEHAIREMLKSAVLALLEEIKDLPSKVTDPGWLDKLEQVDDAGPRESRESRMTPVEAKAATQKAKLRRRRKIETQRQRRAEGHA